MAALAAAPDSAEARRGGGFSRSFGASRGAGSASRGSWGSARPDGYRGKGGLFGSSQRGQGFAPRMNRRGQPFLSRNQATASARASRAQGYQQRFQQPVTVINRNYYGGGAWSGLGWGMYSVGMWDLFFLSTASHMFWYHHWNDPSLQRALYQENLLQEQELRQLEGRVRELEGQGVPRDPNYLPENVDADVAYAKDYVEKNPGEFYADSAADESQSGVWILLGLSAAGLLGYMLFVRRV